MRELIRLSCQPKRCGLGCLLKKGLQREEPQASQDPPGYALALPRRRNKRSIRGKGSSLVYIWTAVSTRCQSDGSNNLQHYHNYKGREVNDTVEEV